MELDPIYKLEVNKFSKIHDTNSNKYLKPRSGHRIVCNNTALYLVGGYLVHHREEELFREVWRFDFTNGTWRKLDADNLTPELASCAVIMSGRLLFLYGGTGLPFGDRINKSVYVCKLPTTKNSVKFEEIKPVGNVCPVPRYGQSIALVGNYLYTVGGTDGHRYSMDVYRLNMETCMWEQLYDGSDEMSKPEPRYRHEIVYYNDRLYILGGGTSNRTFTLETIPAFNLTKRTWEMLKTVGDDSTAPLCFPMKRKCHGCVQDPQDAALVFVNGGFRKTIYVYNDTWRLNLNTLQWKRIPSLDLPYGIYFHSSAVTPEGRMIVFGGITKEFSPMQRTANMFSAWIRVPKLADACWEAVLHYIHTGVFIMPSDLCNVRLPPEYKNRLRFLDPAWSMD